MPLQPGRSLVRDQRDVRLVVMVDAGTPGGLVVIPLIQAQVLTVRVRVAELVQETRADFAAGQVQGVDLPRAGASGLTARPEGGVFTSAVLTTEFPASHVGLLAEAAVDQTSNGFSWQTPATVELAAGQTCEVALSNAAAGTVIVYAVRLLLTSG